MKVELRKKTINEWGFKHEGVECKVVFWTDENMKSEEHRMIYPHKGIWNSYFIIREEHLKPEQFKKLVMKKKYLSYLSGKRIMYDYYPLNRMIEMSGGITFYKLNKTNKKELNRYVEIGNDYNHIWDEDEYYDENIIAQYLVEVVDRTLNWLGVKEIKNDYN